MNEPRVQMIELSCLRAHPANSNVMKPVLLDKLVEHIRASGRYPPIIVRKMCSVENSDTSHIEHGTSDITYQVLDGHHRWKALEQLGYAQAACVVWEADDAQALVLLATLNRLQGQDDPRKRAALLTELHERYKKTAGELGRLLPDAQEDLKKLLALGAKPALLRLAQVSEAGLPGSVFFFLDGEQRRRLEDALKQVGGTREQALMTMVDRIMAESREQEHGQTEDETGEGGGGSAATGATAGASLDAGGGPA